MISRHASEAADPWGHTYPRDPQCEGCGRSMIGRFGEEILGHECPSCEDSFRLVARAGKVFDEEGNRLEFSFHD